MDSENVRDVTSAYLQQRLKRLGEHGHVRNLFDTGLYELVDDPFEVDELTDELADATGTTPEEIERGAEDVDMAPPVEATVVDGGFECVCGATRKTPLGINRHRSMCPEARDE